MLGTAAIVLGFVFSGVQSAAAVAEESVATAAYRAGRYGAAETLWNDELLAAEEAPERARLAYNLGNVAYRQGNVEEAVGWYTAALRLTPRDPDVWANLELARTESGLEPADRGDLESTTKRLVSAFTLAESEWLVIGLMLLLGACLGGEALRGGKLWRRLSFGALLLVAGSLAPFTWNKIHEGGQPMMIVSKRAVPARAEPRPDAKRITEFAPGLEVERLDGLPGWVKVAAPDGLELWVRDTAVFDLSI
jgi:tetratricopeptide (TPR) repeat protein